MLSQKPAIQYTNPDAPTKLDLGRIGQQRKVVGQRGHGQTQHRENPEAEVSKEQIGEEGEKNGIGDNVHDVCVHRYCRQQSPILAFLENPFGRGGKSGQKSRSVSPGEQGHCLDCHKGECRHFQAPRPRFSRQERFSDTVG